MKYATFSLLPRSCEKEDTLLAIRPHWIEILPALSLIVFSTISLLGIVVIIFLKVALYPHFFGLGAIAILLLGSLVTFVTIARWYYHGYILTSGKIMEYYCLPLLMHISNGILLHQVRCTEIDVSKNGLIQHLFDIGDITITFDRPTKQTEFVLHHIYHPSEVGESLSDILDMNPIRREATNDGAPIWPRNPYSRPHQLIFTQDLLPNY